MTEPLTLKFERKFHLRIGTRRHKAAPIPGHDQDLINRVLFYTAFRALLVMIYAGKAWSVYSPPVRTDTAVVGNNSEPS